MQYMVTNKKMLESDIMCIVEVDDDDDSNDGLAISKKE
jgi:hypothetical protein